MVCGVEIVGCVEVGVGVGAEACWGAIGCHPLLTASSPTLTKNPYGCNSFLTIVTRVT